MKLKERLSGLFRHSGGPVNSSDNESLMEKQDVFLKFNYYLVLKNAGSISAEIAKELADGEYEKFRMIQR